MTQSGELYIKYFITMVTYPVKLGYHIAENVGGRNNGEFSSLDYLEEKTLVHGLATNKMWILNIQ